MISKRLRYEVLRRDEFTCRYCGASAPDVKLTVDHVTPIALGGTDEPSNLVAACAGCNAGKASTSPTEPIVEDVAHDALRWRKAMDAAAEIQADHRAKRDAYVEAFDAHWLKWHTLGENDEPTGKIDRPDDWPNSIGRFFDLGLELDALLGAATTALNNPRVSVRKTFAYFCGVCWNIVRDRQDMAAGLLAKDEGDAE